MITKSFIVNKNIPKEVISKLSVYGDVILFSTTGITYPQVSSHPDLFFCDGSQKWVVAPNTSLRYIQKLKSLGVDFILGSKPVGNVYPKSALYNAVVTENYLIHNFSVTDSVILKTYSGLTAVSIPQGYGRCNLLPLKDDHFITSDKGIYKVLKSNNMEVLYINDDSIILPGFDHGFFGGCAGVNHNIVFLSGSLDFFPEGEKIKSYLHRLNYQIVELYNGPLFDGGSILVV